MSSPLKPLAEQVVLITGASSGIGLATARQAAAAGARVMLVARNGEALARIADDIRAAGGDADFAVADVGVYEEVHEAGRKAVARYGRIDSWVSNAGVAIYSDLLATPLDEHRRLFQTNYFGTVHSAVVAAEHLRGGGALIVVGSVASEIPSPVMGAYSASKHAVRAYVESLRIELQAAGSPISVTLIKPSGMATPIGEHAANHVVGEALIPPPAYDPALTADAILRAATKPVREETVGGAGRAQVLFGTHFPRLFERLAPLVTPFLHDRDAPKTPESNLFAPGDGGRVYRAEGGHGRSFSLQALLRRPPMAIAALALGTAAAAGLLLRRRRS